MYFARKSIIFIFILISSFYFFSASAGAQGFDPNNIISDQEILDYTAMNLADIQKFLETKKSYLANYKLTACTDEDVAQLRACSGGLKSAAEIIYDRSQTHQVNPRFILVLLQKEQSLIEAASPTQNSLDWAVGYGCPDNQDCNERWRGFWKQINSSSMQFKDYMDNPNEYTYKAGDTYSFTNPYGTISKEPVIVTPANQATAALYNYTPHVYNGNFNFYKIWQRYFTRVYPDGSLLQADGEVGVWLVQDGLKRPFISQGALLSRFDPKKIIQVNKSDLDAYLIGAPIKFPQYSLIRSPRGTIFLLVDNKKRGFTTLEAFRKMGFNPGEVVNASWEDINSYLDGANLTATSTYPTGALLQDKKTGGIYFVSEGAKAPLVDKIFLTTKFKNKKIIKVSPAELDQYQTVKPVLFADGELLKTPDSPYAYVISGGKKILLASDKVFQDLGYKTENIIIVPSKVLYLYEAGLPITEAIVSNGQ